MTRGIVSALMVLFLLGRQLWTVVGQDSNSSSATVMTVTTISQLQEEILNFGATGGNVTIYIAADRLDMRQADLGSAWIANTSKPGMFTSGSLTLVGQPPSGAAHTVIDAAMKEGLIPAFTPPAALYISNLTIVNNCEVTRDLNRQGRFFSTALFAEIFLNNPNQFYSRSFINIYGRRSDLALWLYIGIAKSIPFTEVKARTSYLVAEQTGGGASEQVFNTYYWSASLEFAHWNNVTLRTLDNPDDQLINGMRANGTLLPPQYCNGTLLPAELVDEPVERRTGPLYLASTTPDFLHALDQAINLSALQDAEQMPPPLVLYGGHYNLSTQLVPEPVHVPGDVILWGAPIQLPKITPLNAILDFERRQGVFVLDTPDVNIYFAAHILTGLAKAIPPALPGYPQPTIPQALPIQAIQTPSTPDTWVTDPAIQMLLCRLELPPADYMAMVLIAMKPVADISACMDSSTVALAAQMSAGIYRADVYQYDQEGLKYLFLRNFTGWGIMGTVINVMPDTPIPPSVVQPCIALLAAANSTSSSSSKLTHSQRAGIIAGSVLGGLCLVSLLVFAVIAIRNRSLAARDESPSGSITDCKVTAAIIQDPSVKLRIDAVKQSKSPSIGSAQSLWQLVSDAEQSHYHKAGFDSSIMIDEGDVEVAITDGTSNTTAHITPGTNTDHLSPVVVSAAFSPLSCETIKEGESEGFETAVETHAIHNAAQGLDNVVMLSALSVRDAAGVPSGPASLIKRQRRATLQDRDADRVVIKDVLGQGGWGTVLAGEWRGVPVAVKTMVFNWSGTNITQHNTPAARREARAIMEAAIAASVGHPNLVATYCYDIKPVGAAKSTVGKGSLEIEELFSEDPGTGGPTSSNTDSSAGRSREYKMYLIQELCGCSLGDAVEAGVLMQPDNPGAPQPATVFNVLLDVVRGLEYLHGKGIVHGDLKPDNVLLKTTDQASIGVVAKLGDFGLSTHLREGQSHISGYNAGTPFFVAPEVIRQFRTSPASDMYSFGVMMWQLWTSQSPFVHNATCEVVWNPAFGTWKEPHVPPPAYKELFEKCLSLDYYARPTATQARQQLETLLPTGQA